MDAGWWVCVSLVLQITPQFGEGQSGKERGAGLVNIDVTPSLAED
jgi:hypothetical protein